MSVPVRYAQDLTPLQAYQKQPGPSGEAGRKPLINYRTRDIER